MSKKREYEVASEEYLMAKVMYDDALLALGEGTGTQLLVDESLNNYRIKQNALVSKMASYHKYCAACSSLTLAGITVSILLDETVENFQNYQQGTLNRNKLVDQFNYLLDSIFDVDGTDREQTFEDVRLELQSQADLIASKLALASVI